MAAATYAGGNGRILLVEFRNAPVLVSKNLDGSQPQQYGTNADAGAFSPDGKRVAYFGSDGSSTGIFVANVDGSGNKLVAPEIPVVDSGEATVSWTPDGHHVVFAQSNGVLIEADVDTGVQTPLAPGRSVAAPVVSPDGTHIAYLSSQVSGNDNQLHIMSFDGSNDQIIYSLPSNYNIEGVGWAPSSGELAFIQSAPPCCASQQGEEVAINGALLHTIPSALAVVWAPDQSRLLVESLSGPQYIETNLGGHNPQPVLTGETNGTPIDWQSTH